MFDSHCHLDFEVFDADRDHVLQRARQAGVTAIHVPGICPDQWARARDLSLAHAMVGYGVGIHPWWIAKLTGGALADGLDALETAAEGAEAVGESGLDRGVAKRGGPGLDAQAEVFRAHLEVAKRLAKPIVIHLAGAHGLGLKMLTDYGPLPGGGILHSYSGSTEMVPRFVAQGLHVSFSPAVARTGARRPRASAKAVPLDRLLVESDGPDQSLDGRRGEPASVVAICDAIGELRGESIRRAVHANAARVFQRTFTGEV